MGLAAGLGAGAGAYGLAASALGISRTHYELGVVEVPPRPAFKCDLREREGVDALDREVVEIETWAVALRELVDQAHAQLDASEPDSSGQ